HTALFNDTALIRNSVIFFYITNEGISILENAVVIGIPVPDFLKDKLLEFRDKKIRQKRKIKKKC
ncbi:MAG: phage holin family protein, partial [Synergistaceae bacterium]|nr:phage holin family protein [Synergistaceae bacterium]